MGDGRRLANLLMLVAAIAAGIIFGVWVFESVTG
jgi:hypothetical protein